MMVPACGSRRNTPSGKRRPTSVSGIGRTTIPFAPRAKRTGTASAPSSPLRATWWDNRKRAGGPSRTAISNSIACRVVGAVTRTSIRPPACAYSQRHALGETSQADGTSSSA
jgi:hypothetical protein